MALVSTYKLDSYGTPQEISDPRGGVFQLTDASWRLLFRHSKAGVTCGLLRSEVEIETARRRRCWVTVSENGGTGFRATFVLRTHADDLRADLEARHSSLDRAAEVVAAVDGGEWWRSSHIFNHLGWARARSIAGVRCVGGSWGTRPIRSTRRPRVLDFGEGGVSLRGWRTPLTIPWVSIAAIEVADGPQQPAAHSATGRRRSAGTVIVLRCHSGEQIAFHTMLLTPMEVQAELSSLIECVVRSWEVGTTPTTPACIGASPMPVPELLLT